MIPYIFRFFNRRESVHPVGSHLGFVDDEPIYRLKFDSINDEDLSVHAFAWLLYYGSSVIKYESGYTHGITSSNEADYHSLYRGIVCAHNLGVSSLDVVSTNIELINKIDPVGYNIPKYKSRGVRKILSLAKKFDMIDYDIIDPAENMRAIDLCNRAIDEFYTDIISIKKKKRINTTIL